MKNFRRLTHLILLSFLMIGCGEKQKDDYVVIGITSDPSVLNPMYALSYNEGLITEALFPGLVGHEWNEEIGDLESYPLLAKSWRWSVGKDTLLIILRDDILWSDSVKITTEDVLFSFSVYSNPAAGSKFYGTFDKFFTNEDLSVDEDKSFKILSPDSIYFFFKPRANPTLFNVDLPLLPAHILGEAEPEKLPAHEFNQNPIGSGAYKLEKWNRNETIVLSKNEYFPFISNESIEKIIFKIAPDYSARLIQLKNGEIDLMEDLRPDDANALRESDEIIITPRKGRDYDYAGWNNIDVEEFKANGKIKPNPLFGSAKVREALALAIDKKLIFEEYLLNAGELAVSPIAPIFRNAFDPTLEPVAYDPSLAKKILIEEGWRDVDGDGVLEKNNREFKFTLSIPGGNPLRNSAAVTVKENLAQIGLEVELETLEPGVFFESMFNKELEAWIAGWSVAIPLDLRPFWHSDIEANFPNAASFQNKEIDKIIESIETATDDGEKNNLLKKFQLKMKETQPVTFLYWIDNQIGYNARIKNIQVDPLGSVQKIWEWRL